MTTKVVQHQRFFGTTLNVVVDRKVVGKSAQQVADELDTGNPRVWVGVEGENTITVNVHVLNEGEQDTVATRLRSALSR